MMGKKPVLQDQNACSEDPFTSPMSSSSASPTLPKRCAQPLCRPVYPKSGSLSSGDSYGSSPASSMELAKEHEINPPSRESQRGAANIDPEKNPRPSSNPGIATRITYDDEDDEVDNGRQMQEEKAVSILLFLSGPCVLLSAMNTVWACIALIITLLSQPIRLCAERPSVGQQLAGLLSPTLNLQLRRIYTPLPPHANEDGSYDSFKLFVGHLLSPFLSFVMMFAAWTLTVYWVTSACIGDPAGQDKRDDGKETVLGLRKWWEKWLMRGVEREQ